MWIWSWESTATAPTWPQIQPSGISPQFGTSSYCRSPASISMPPPPPPRPTQCAVSCGSPIERPTCATSRHAGGQALGRDVLLLGHLADDEVEGAPFAAARQVGNLHFELTHVVAVAHAALVIREVQLGGIRPTIALDLHMDVPRLARLVAGWHDGLHAVAALGVGEDVAAQVEADHVVVAHVVRLPEVDHRARDRLAALVQHPPGDLQRRAADARLDQRRPMR